MSATAKYFCYFCQEKVRPSVGPRGRYCSQCGCYLIDENTDFFRVCSKCGSNLPTDAAVCLLCGYHFSGENAKRVYHFKRCLFFRQKSKEKTVKKVAVGKYIKLILCVAILVFAVWLLI